GGGRFDVRVLPHLALGAGVAYANLPGEGERVHNVLPHLLVESRVRPSPAMDLTIPVRLVAGYLPFNGPVVRVSLGVALPIDDAFEVAFDLVAPTFWVVDDAAVFSMDVAAEVAYRF
ncbi:MAG: hypothetical protein KC416_12730, partial [Myxococcales bacterium]|nr:hypothetical protein [Myxococcales bacterium]